MQPPDVGGPSTAGRHRAVPTEAATATSPRRLGRRRNRLAALSGQPPRALRWGLLGAALVILIAVPTMSLSEGGGPTRDIATLPTADELEAEPTARITSTPPTTGSRRSTPPGPPSTSSAAAAPATDAVVARSAVADSGVGPGVGPGVGSAQGVRTAGGGGSAGGSSAPAAAGGGASGGGTPGGSGSGAGNAAGSGGGSATTTHRPAAGGQAGGSPPASKTPQSPAPTTQQPAPTSSTPAPAPAPPTEQCLIDLLGLEICM